MTTPSLETLHAEEARKRRNTMLWVCGIALVGLIFDGYDLVVYGAVLPMFLADPSLIGEVTRSSAGLLGSLAMIGVLVGALSAGAVADLIGRRKVMLMSYAWFSVGMFATSLMSSYNGFGLWRFLTGLGVGALVATTGAIVSEFAPPGKKNTATAVVYAGVPLGSLLAALLAIFFQDALGWSGLFKLGALPLVTLLPLAYFKMPESVSWLASRGRLDEAAAISAKTGVPVPVATAALKTDHDHAGEAARKAEGPAGFAGLFSAHYLFPTIVLGIMSASCLLLVYALNTWLPVIMQSAGMDSTQSLTMLLFLNGGAIVGAVFGSRFSDKIGPKPTVIVCFLIGALGILAMTLFKSVGLLLIVVAIVGLGTSGTQTLIFGLIATFYRTNVRAAGVAWGAGFGRIGGILGPIVGGMLAAAYGPKTDAAGVVTDPGNLNMIFYILAGIAVLGAICCAIVRRGVDEDAANHSVVHVDPHADHLDTDTILETEGSVGKPAAGR
ncbi:MAG: MFS transporter [Actinomycetales bacterium]